MSNQLCAPVTTSEHDVAGSKAATSVNNARRRDLLCRSVATELLVNMHLESLIIT